MAPEEFDQRGRVRRRERQARNRLRVWDVIWTGGVMLLFAFIVFNVVWGVMGP